MKEKIKCYKCLVTLDKLKKDNISEFLIKVVRENGKEYYICPVCFQGW